MADPTIRVDTPYGPLDVRVFAGPTSVPGTTYASDHVHPSKAHAFGREPDALSVGARVHTPRDEYLTINGVTYLAEASFVLTSEPMGSLPAGWREERGGYHPLSRYGAAFGEQSPTEGARKAWRERVVPLVVAALTKASTEVAEAKASARERFAADVVGRAAELRAEADRLERMLDRVIEAA